MPRTPGAKERKPLERIVELVPSLSRRQLVAMRTYLAGLMILKDVMEADDEETIADAAERFPRLDAESLKEALRASDEAVDEAALDDVAKIMELATRLTENEFAALIAYVDGVKEMKNLLSE